MNIVKTVLLAVVTMGLALVPVAVPVAVIAEGTQPGLCAGANLQAPNDTNGDCENINDQASESVNNTVNLIINIFSWIVGVVSVIMIIWGGFKYITSGGDSNSVTAAKNTILYAIVGLIIVALAQVIVKFVLGNVTQQ